MRRHKTKSRRGLSTVVGTLFFIAVIFVAIGTFIVMFNAFSGYGSSLKTFSQNLHQNQSTSIAVSSLSFNSSATTISISTSSTGTYLSSQRKVLYGQGLWWAFYSAGSSGISYETSPDGLSWSSSTKLISSSGSQYGSTFSLWQSGSTVYYLMASADTSKSFLWRYGTLQTSGTITWSISQTNVTTTGTTDYYGSIAADTSGNTWVALNTIQGSSNNHIEVWNHANGAPRGTWTKVTDLSSLPTDVTPILAPLSSGAVAMVYGTGAETGQVYIVTSTTGWNSPVTPPSKYAMFDSSAVAIGNTIYFGGLASSSSGSTTGTVNFWSFASGQTATSGEIVLQSSSGSWSTALSEISNTILVFYGTGTNLYEASSQDLGNTFSSTLTISSLENSLTGVDSAYNMAGVIWMSGGSSPFNIRFASLGIVSINNNSPFAIHAVSLYIYNPSSSSLAHFDTNSTAPGVLGKFDYWIGSARVINVPLAFPWSTTQNYLVTVATDQGVLASLTDTSPA